MYVNWGTYFHIFNLIYLYLIYFKLNNCDESTGKLQKVSALTLTD